MELYEKILKKIIMNVETINTDNVKAQMRKGILEYCILLILAGQ